MVTHSSTFCTLFQHFSSERSCPPAVEYCAGKTPEAPVESRQECDWTSCVEYSSWYSTVRPCTNCSWVILNLSKTIQKVADWLEPVTLRENGFKLRPRQLLHKDLEQVLRTQLLCSTTASARWGVQAHFRTFCKKGDIKDQLYHIILLYQTMLKVTLHVLHSTHLCQQLYSVEKTLRLFFVRSYIWHQAVFYRHHLGFKCSHLSNTIVAG